MNQPPVNHRVLLIDDTPSIHDDFRKILCAPHEGELAGLERALFDGPQDALSQAYDLHSAHQGEEGLAAVKEAVRQGNPFALAFVDMRMPPGWDGLETVEQLWKADPELQIVICTAYSDNPWEDVLGRLDARDQLLILKKPFDMVEVSQLAHSLCAKWSLGRAAALREKDLEAAVGQRTSELAVALEAAQAANTAKSDFLANMSHEVRTPLNAIRGLLHLLSQTQLDERQRTFVEKAQSSSAHLLGIVSDVLDFSRADAGRLSLQNASFDLREMVQGVADMLTEKCRAKDLALALDLDAGLPRQVIGDALRLRQILLNFADNAVKFTAAGRIAFSASLVSGEGGTAALRFEFRDTGIGLTREQMDKLFRKFEQADASITRRFGGTGLGLAISKELAQMMGGSVGVSSAPGVGSTFWLTVALPVDTAAPQVPVHAEQASEEPLRGSRVLLVEDNEINQIVAVELLKDLGVDADVAENGEKALERIASNGGGYALVLMDMQMPVMDGVTATRAIRRMPGQEHLPVIAMTANVREQDRKQCMEAGMDDFLGKPIEPELLKDMLAKWLAPRRSGVHGAKQAEAT